MSMAGRQTTFNQRAPAPPPEDQFMTLASVHRHATMFCNANNRSPIPRLPDVSRI